ncbi:NADPH-dependent FMN reductase [Saccharobesus litoralis]|uniref:NADPH-dependent FMN reductase n=1 Tax=Saccharobesus litoralis TaxID=2172099 RepID=A0A2S0VPF1_9ALTE|nr:NAD(P)H-dependent oxidoreductase [Saccharobesus litoralis]AWB66086.1 NADPH-dependent FMN reductase [Saccharobesus litoralis]
MNKITVFCASNNDQSINRTLANIVVNKIATRYSVQTKLADIRDYPLPIYSLPFEKQHGFPEPVHVARELFANADAMVICCPEHNGSTPAVFKNLIDWMSRLETKQQMVFPKNQPVLLLSTSPGKRGGLTNLNHLSDVMPWWGANIISKLAIGDFYNVYADGQFSALIESELDNLLNQFVLSIDSYCQAV